MSDEGNKTLDKYKLDTLWQDKENAIYATVERIKPIEAFFKGFICFILIGVGTAMLAMVLK